VGGACSDPTTDASNTDWAALLGDTSNSANSTNSCLKDDTNGIATETDNATESTGGPQGFFDSQWFEFHCNPPQIGTPILATTMEWDNISGTVPVPLGPTWGVYGTADTQGSAALGAFLGVLSLQVGLTNTGAPSIDFGVNAGMGQLSCGVDAAPMMEAGGQALYNIEHNLEDSYGPTGPGGFFQ
jgi:hypothetical protein